MPVPIAPPSQRPDSTSWASALFSAPARPWSHRLIINIRSRGDWATFLVPNSMSDCLLRPGVLEFSGSTRDWLPDVPKLNAWDEVPGDMAAHFDRPGPLMVPVESTGSGVLVIDYDSRSAWNLQFYGRATELEPKFWRRGKQDPREGWARHMVLAGRFTHARDHAGPELFSLPSVPAGLVDALGWLESEGSRAWAPHYPGVLVADLVFPLAAPGWTLIDDQSDRIVHLLSGLEALHPGEIRCWQKWARHHGLPALALTRIDELLMDRAVPLAATSTPRHRM